MHTENSDSAPDGIALQGHVADAVFQSAKALRRPWGLAQPRSGSPTLPMPITDADLHATLIRRAAE